MYSTAKSLLAVAVVATIAGANANASVVIFETASSTAGSQASALAYRSVVEQALSQPGARSATLTLFDNASNHTVFGGPTTNIAFRTTIQFDVSAAHAGLWGIRAGVDYGRGGAVFLDGLAIGFSPINMWWAGSYANPSQSFQFPSLTLAPGPHTLQLYGLEDCCDGGQQAQFRIKDGPYTTFGTHDGIGPTGNLLEITGTLSASSPSAVHEFQIVTPGSYKVTLIDNALFVPFEQLGVGVVKTGGATLGSILAPGGFVFEALVPGSYSAVVGGVAGAGVIPVGTYGVSVTLVPEAETWILMLAGISLLAWQRRRQRSLRVHAGDAARHVA